jgi:hypothetical protein
MSGATATKPDQPSPYEVGGYRRPRWAGLGLVGGGLRTIPDKTGPFSSRLAAHPDAWLRGLSLADYLARFRSVPGAISPLMFLLFAAMPTLVGPRQVE